jgi:hypothetical protein
MVKLKPTNDLKIKTGTLAEYFFPDNVELSTLYGVRSTIFNAKSRQEVLDVVQSRITKVLKLEIDKETKQ